MGANSDDRSFKDMPFADLERVVAEHIKTARYEDGNDPYAGTWAVKDDVEDARPGHVFASADEAYDWCYGDDEHGERRVDKWGSILAVKYRDTDSKEITLSSTTLALRESLKSLNKQAWEYNNERAREIRSGKSAKRTCPGCGSAVAVKFVRGVACPVCNSDKFGLTETDLKNKESITRRIAETEQRIKAAEEKDIASAAKKGVALPVKWLCCALCSS